MIKKYKRNKYLQYFFISIIINLLIEIGSRKEIGSIFVHITSGLGYFLFNVCIIACTLSISGFFIKKLIPLSIISASWIILGIVNGCLLSVRITPLSAIDFFILEFDPEFLIPYLTPTMILLFLGSMIILFFSGVFLLRKAKRTDDNKLVTCKVSVSYLFICMAMYGLLTNTGSFDKNIIDMNESYDEYGFVTCFVRSAIDRGMEEPETYSKETVEAIINEYEFNDVSSLNPNIIVIQLESFIDPAMFQDVEFSENPIPTFTKLSEEYTSGMLEVAVVGSGTANSEFEVLTGMSIAYLGAGEYPYETFLQHQTCESFPYLFKQLGYSTFALHNNTATFYKRNTAYPNLGFDTFVSSEFMTNTTTSKNGWIKDKYLTPEIIKCMESTENQDFIFAVSVEGHGAYSSDKQENRITITSSPYNETKQNTIENYSNQLYEMDIFIKELSEYVENLEEPTVLVMYGDHVPPLDIEATDLTTESMYQTPYLVYSNFVSEVNDQDIYSYQLLSTVCNSIDNHVGVMNQLHQEAVQDIEYQEKLQLLQYDLLYGQSYANEGMQYLKTNMGFGVTDIQPTYVLEDQYLYLTDENITESSVVFLDNQEIHSELLENHRLRILVEDIKEHSYLTIKQRSKNDTILYTSTPVFLP